MDALAAAQTLNLWEACDGLTPVRRSLVLAAAASGAAVDDVEALPLGRRDALVLELHRSLGGGTLEATAECSACGEPVDFCLEPAALLARERERVDAVQVEAGSCVVAWRPPDSRDVAAAAEQADALAAERLLISRCVVHALGPDGETMLAEALPPEAREAVAAAMLESDPLAEVLVALGCPACDTSFTAELDVSTFVFSHLRARGQRLLYEVHTLASAHGWTESEVLALDERRRSAYLELVWQGGR
jgi:hypothetical protein